MKFLIIGLGSMGKRRIRNLKALNENEIIGFDLNSDRCNEVVEKYQIKAYTNFSECLKEKPDALIISTPPDLHMKYALEAIKHNIHFFTEASVVQDEMSNVVSKLENSKIIGLPSCTMRYHPIVLKINEILTKNNLGKVLAFFHHSGQYLPDWHPWEDYKKFYVSKYETGACREIVPFELVWLTSTFGKIESVIGNKGKISNIDVEIDDIYNTIIEFKNGIKGVLTVDVIARTPIRQLRILTEEGVIEADWYKNEVNVFTKESGKYSTFVIDSGKPEEGYIHGEKMYVQEIEHFIKSIKNEVRQNYTFKEDLEILKILEKIEKSSDTGVSQNI
jgi:predicted dehydrogenase